MSGLDQPAVAAQSIEETPTKSTPPALIEASITPPPSSQLPYPSLAHGRSHSPTNSQLTSPPPTTHAPPMHMPARRLSATVDDEEVHDMSIEDLRNLVAGLRLELREARTLPAHFQLQYKMLQMDSAERENRLTVELEMAQREIEALISAEERRNQAMMSPSSAVAEATTANAALLNDLQRQLTTLTQENEQLRDIVVRQKKDAEYREGIIVGFEEEVERLRGRIRKNREHVNGLLDNIYESNGSPRSWMGTPHRASVHQTPRHMPQRQILPTSQPRDNQPFEALLLADKVLSQEIATAPSTPRTQPPPSKRQQSHTRGVHSLSSMPTTPQQRRHLHPSSRALQTPPHLSAIMEPSPQYQPPPARPVFSLATGPGVRRRGSSDSTISASSGSGGQAVGPSPRRSKKNLVATPSHDDEIPESQASQAATSLLRQTPLSKGGSMPSSVQGSFAPPLSQHSGAKLSQARITGKITKSGVRSPATSAGKDAAEKKRGGGVMASPSKKSRVDHAGLGIALAGSPR